MINIKKSSEWTLVVAATRKQRDHFFRQMLIKSANSSYINITKRHIMKGMDDIEKYQNKWDIGTRGRLAMKLLLWTSLRRGDIVRLGRQHVRDGMAKLPATEKTDVDIYVTIPDYLDNIIRQSPTSDMAFIATTT